MSFPVEPHAIVDISIWIAHLSSSAFEVILPFSFVNFAIGVVVSSPALFPVFYYALKAITIFEDVYSVDKIIVFPISEVKVSLKVHAVAVSFVICWINLSVVYAIIQILLFDHCDFSL